MHAVMDSARHAVMQMLGAPNTPWKAAVIAVAALVVATLVLAHAGSLLGAPMASYIRSACIICPTILLWALLSGTFERFARGRISDIIMQWAPLGIGILCIIFVGAFLALVLMRTRYFKSVFLCVLTAAAMLAAAALARAATDAVTKGKSDLGRTQERKQELNEFLSR